MALVRAESGRCVVGHEQTRVRFGELSEGEIDEYVRTGEPADKAGAYAIQGRAALFIEGIEGDFWNVVGLPVRLVYRLARESRTDARQPRALFDCAWACRWAGGNTDKTDENGYSLIQSCQSVLIRLSRVPGRAATLNIHVIEIRSEAAHTPARPRRKNEGCFTTGSTLLTFEGLVARDLLSAEQSVERPR